MSLSPKQTKRYWREWGDAARKQGWKGAEADDRRRQIHKQARCPHSMKDFDNRAFDRFLAEVAGYQNKVDIRDREAERVEVAVERLNAALRDITGKDFARGIVRDMNDREDPRTLALDPIADQVARGEAVANPEKYGKRGGGYDGAESDLTNLRDTLKNRLSKLLSRIKGTGKGRTASAERIHCPEALRWVEDVANNAAIAAIIAGKIAIRRTDGRAVWYEQVSRADYERGRATRPAEPSVAPPVQPLCAPRENPYAAIEAAVGYTPLGDDDNIPF